MQASQHAMPAASEGNAEGSNAPVLATWLEYSRLETRYLEAKAKLLEQDFAGPEKLDLDLIWNGDGRNPNGALTVFRHFNSASVVKGLVGEPPKTAWVISYPLLERIHYLLVAGFDVYGNVGHQLSSRLYMDFLRMEGEFNFLTFLPRARLESVRDFWYRGASRDVKEYLHGRMGTFDQETGIDYRTADPQRELYDLLKTRLAAVLQDRYDLESVEDAALRRELAALAALRGRSLSWLPEAAFLRVDATRGRTLHFTLLRNTGHANVAHVFSEDQEILPDEHTLTVVPGLIGAYPNALYAVSLEGLRDLAQAIGRLSSEADYRALADRFAIRRSNPEFWAHSDLLHAAQARAALEEASFFDYGRLENR
jgi:hypothetical protein